MKQEPVPTMASLDEAAIAAGWSGWAWWVDYEGVEDSIVAHAMTLDRLYGRLAGDPDAEAAKRIVDAVFNDRGAWDKYLEPEQQEAVLAQYKQEVGRCSP